MFAGNVADHVTDRAFRPVLHAGDDITRNRGAIAGCSVARCQSIPCEPVPTTGKAGGACPTSWAEPFSRSFSSATRVQSASDLFAKARQIKRKHGLDLIVIDYLQLMTAPGNSNRTQEIGSKAVASKALAKRTAGADHRPGSTQSRCREPPRQAPHDVRSSATRGEVEQDADIVVMLHRESLYNDAPEMARHCRNCWCAKIATGRLATSPCITCRRK